MVSAYLKNKTSSILVCLEALFEIALALIIFSVFCCWQSLVSRDYDFCYYLIYFLGVWSIQRAVINEDFSIFLLMASLFYDACFGFYFAFYTCGLLVYSSCVRSLIYIYVSDRINQLFFLVGYLSFLYLCSWTMMVMIDCYQSAIQPWTTKKVVQALQ